MKILSSLKVLWVFVFNLRLINVKEKCWQQSLQKLNPFLRPQSLLKPFSIVSLCIYFFGVFMQCHVWIHLVKYCHAECVTEPDWICFWVDHRTTRRLATHVQHSCVCLYLLVFMSPNPLQIKKSHTGSRAEQFGRKQPTSCALRRTWERETERKRPRQRKGSQRASADPLSHTERVVQFPLPPTCSALASFRMQWWLQQHCGRLQVTSSFSPVFICFAFCLIWAIMKEKHLSWCCLS